MLNFTRRICRFYIRERMRSAGLADEHRVTLGEVRGNFRLPVKLDKATVTVISIAGRNTFGDNGTLCILSDVNHLRTCISLLLFICYSNRVELTNRVVSLQNDTWVLQCNGRTCLELCPGYL